MEETKHRKVISSWYDEESLLSTEFRRLFSKLRNLNPNKEIKDFLVTSATIGEGKSTIAALLALTISKYRDTKTLLIDCDLRRPTIHKLFGFGKQDGVSDVVLKKISLKSVIKDTFIPNLKVVTSGELTASPADIFNLPAIKDLFVESKFYFDTLIVDSAPIIPVSDTLVLSSETDGALMVVRAGKTPREMVKRAADLMKNSGTKILGVILNNVEQVLPYYYGYRNDYYYYTKNSKHKELVK